MSLDINVRLDIGRYLGALSVSKSGFFKIEVILANSSQVGNSPVLNEELQMICRIGKM